MVRTLYEFEGWRCLWRIPASALLFVTVPLFLVGVMVAATTIDGDGSNFQRGIIAAVVAVGGGTYLYPRLNGRQLHRKVIADRLWTWEAPNPPTHIQIALRDIGVDRARHVLRRAGFNPGAFRTPLSAPPDDAPDLNVRVGVEEPAAHPQSSSDRDRAERMADALDAAGIRARIAGIDVPYGTAP
ncbi:MAG: hypothetical protein WD399_05185 [Thermoleophilaceae bacterium]